MELFSKVDLDSGEVMVSGSEISRETLRKKVDDEGIPKLLVRLKRFAGCQVLI